MAFNWFKQNGLVNGMEDLERIQYADLETYFVANDAQDQEYLPLNTRWECKDPSGNVIGNPTQNFNECSERIIFLIVLHKDYSNITQDLVKYIQEGTVGGQGGAPMGWNRYKS